MLFSGTIFRGGLTHIWCSSETTTNHKSIIVGFCLFVGFVDDHENVENYPTSPLNLLSCFLVTLGK